MPTYRYGGQRGKAYTLEESNNYLVVRTRSRRSLLGSEPYEVADISPQSRVLLSKFEAVSKFRVAGVEVLHRKGDGDTNILQNETRLRLKTEPDIQFAGRVLVEPNSHRPVIYTENLFVKFKNPISRATCQEILNGYDLNIARVLGFSQNAFFLKAREGIGTEIFTVAEQLLKESDVEFCHPELIRHFDQRQMNPNQDNSILSKLSNSQIPQDDTTQINLPQAYPHQWHLQTTTIGEQLVEASANVVAAWPLSQGEDITIAIIDSGFDLDHEEFRSLEKIVAPRDSVRRTNDPSPDNSDHHGTACAGVACANGHFGATGVAPKSKLMPIRLALAGLGSIAEAEAFEWAVLNGADVISCSWGPKDGLWFDTEDPLHNSVMPLPDSTRLAIEFALEHGRNGKGCVICWAAGNGNESADNDGYASFSKVITVAACNDQGTRSAYSDFGDCIWCAFPSNHGEFSLTSGIWTTDFSGNGGKNWGTAYRGDEAGNYTNSFGGTSSACPGVAGVAALILARNPQLTWQQVKDVIRLSCDRIDEANGKYDDEGHSSLYGYGRINAFKAIEQADQLLEM